MPSYIGHWFKEYFTSVKQYPNLIWCCLPAGSTTLPLIGRFPIVATQLPLSDGTQDRPANTLGIKPIAYFHVK